MAERRSTITLEVSDRFSAALSAFSKGMKDASTATDAAAKSVDQLGTKQQSLANALGASKAQTGFLVREIASLSGVSGTALTAINALTSGLNPLGLALTGVALAINTAKDAGQQVITRNNEMIASYAKAGMSVDEITRALKAMNAEAMKDRRSAVLVKEWEAIAEAAVKARIATSEGLGNQARLNDYIEGLKRAEKATMDVGTANYNAIQESIALQNAWRANIDDTLSGYGDWRAAILAVSDAYDTVLRSGGQTSDAGTRRMGSDAFEKNQQRQLGLSPEDAAANQKAAEEYASAWEAAEQRRKDAAQRTAEAQMDFQRMVTDASKAATDEQVAMFQQIANSSGTAAQKTAILNAYINSLPNRKDIDIAILFGGNIELAKMLGLYGRGAGVGKGHQQGDEYDFTLEGENYEVRKAYMDKYGDYGRANEAWKSDHRQELKDKYGVTGAGQANTETGEVYKYAGGYHGMVSSARMFTAGESGPERVDITPGTGAGGGMDGATVVNLSFNSLVPASDFEMQQAVRKIQRFMKRDN